MTPQITENDPCGTDNDSVNGVTKAGYRFEVNEEDASVTFTAAENYILDGERTLTAQFTNVPCGGGGGSSSIDSTAVIPNVDQAGPCEVEGSYTIPNTTGVDYFLDGLAIPAGTYDGPASGTITAAAVGGYDLTNDGFSYGLHVAAAEVCPVVVPLVVAPPEVAGTQTASPKPDKAAVVKGVEAVPTAVAAGIGGNGPTVTGVLPIELLAQMLIGGGLVLLMAAGWLQIGRRTHGVHQA